MTRIILEEADRPETKEEEDRILLAAFRDELQKIGEILGRPGAFSLVELSQHVQELKDWSDKAKGWHGEWFAILYDALDLNIWKGRPMSECIKEVIRQRDELKEQNEMWEAENYNRQISGDC